MAGVGHDISLERTVELMALAGFYHTVAFFANGLRLAIRVILEAFRRSEPLLMDLRVHRRSVREVFKDFAADALERTASTPFSNRQTGSIR